MTLGSFFEQTRVMQRAMRNFLCKTNKLQGTLRGLKKGTVSTRSAQCSTIASLWLLGRVDLSVFSSALVASHLSLKKALRALTTARWVKKRKTSWSFCWTNSLCRDVTSVLSDFDGSRRLFWFWLLFLFGVLRWLLLWGWLIQVACLQIEFSSTCDFKPFDIFDVHIFQLLDRVEEITRALNTANKSKTIPNFNVGYIHKQHWNWKVEGWTHGLFKIRARVKTNIAKVGRNCGYAKRSSQCKHYQFKVVAVCMCFKK